MTIAPSLRKIIAALFFFGAAGTLAELALLGHTESLVQFSPFIVIAAGSGAMVWALVRPGPAALRATQVTGAAIAIVGAAGMWYHYRANTEFELEMYPDLRGLDLAWESARGATPALAPGLMIQLGLLGMAFTYRHPASGGTRSTGDPT
jgi:hypothetical protein